MLIKVLDLETGGERWAPIEEIRDAIGQGPSVPPVVPDEPQPGNVLFFDDFSELSIEDGQAPGTGARWADSFVGWKVRRLANPPNLDQAVKRYIEGKTHYLTDEGLVLRSYANPAEITGITGAMISSERSFSFTYGRVDCVLRVGAYPPGVHGTLWLMPKDGSADTEFDALEHVSNNHLGPVSAHFMNAKQNSTGIDNFEWQNLPESYLRNFHKFSLIWTKDDLIWLRDDEEVKRAANFYHEPMFVMYTHEVGASENGQFPGPLDSPLPKDWETTTVIKSIKVERI